MLSIVTGKDVAERGTAFLVFACSAAAGHFAAGGMDAAQWLGAGAAVLGSVALAVTVRLWPKPVEARVRAD